MQSDRAVDRSVSGDRRVPSAAAIAAICVGAFALAAIPTMLIRRDTTHVATAAAATADTVTQPIRMVLANGATVPAEVPARAGADGSAVQLHGQDAPVVSLVFNAGESLMAGTDRLGNAHLWQRNGRLLATVAPATGQRISSVAFTPDGKEWVTVSSDGSLHHWPLPSPD